MEEEAFPGLQISSWSFLDDLSGRASCPKCEKSRKYYCYNCYVPTKETKGLIPKVKLPLKIDIIKHPNECDGKSTSAHAAVLAPNHVNVYTYPCIPNYPDPNKVLLLFPGPEALTLEELAAKGDMKCKDDKCSTENVLGENSSTVEDSTTHVIGKNGETSSPSSATDNDNVPASGKRKADSDKDNLVVKKRRTEPPFDTVVVIDSTWNQTKRISSDERLKDLTKIELKSRETKFWRHQKDNPSTYLSTVEAVYYLVRDYHDLFVLTDYAGEYDNLLFFFSFMYQKIRKLYDGGKNLKAFKERSDRKAKEMDHKMPNKS
ncbi:hypothetical protein FSP39_011125 [Pinctada imbricata]|uniref:tRNA-uridine aminocarboxypropyltransferase 1 n=1 Tax=Pinctada imbricata TaxID=66713 RepID=A0AA88YIX3_PINIB|nr:hypothetical protein FSP39_011125 [Pinctada imbricata]